MSPYTKQYYSIGEVSQMLEIPIYTLRFWEGQFPMFKPNRSPKGTRRYTQADIDMVKAIKSAVYDKGMKIDGAIEYLNKTYRKCPPRGMRVCRTREDALALLDEVKSILEDAHSIAKIAAVERWLESAKQG